MWKAINTWLRNFFGFSRTEANGFVVLLLLMLLVLLAPIISKQILLYNHPDIFLASDYEQLDSLLATMEDGLIEMQPEKNHYAVSDQPEIVLRNFDPNTADTKTLQSLGLPQFLSERIIKYRNKVKSFKQPDDLLLIYGMDSSFFRSLKPYIQIKEVEKLVIEYDGNTSNWEEDSNKYNLKSHHKSPYKFKLQSFDINTADTAQLKKIYGIGEVYAERIVDYRDLLGGFANKTQYNEIYGLKQPNLDSLKKYTKIGKTVQLKQLKLNICSDEELSKHPYISYKQAKLIVSFRNAHGNYGALEDILKIKVIDTVFIRKIAPYLLIEQ